MATKKRIDDYEGKDMRTHVLDRPGMWIGDVEPAESVQYVASREGGEYKIVKRNTITSAALLRIFVEVLSNAIDNVKESEDSDTPCTKIKVNIDKETGETSVWNDGQCIPIEKNNKGAYIHSMVFGEMLTGSKFDDTKDRTVSGTNGVGVKACLKSGETVPTFDGQLVRVDDVVVGDKLIGDDGLPRTVLATCDGESRLFEISHSRGLPYTVNGKHRLTVRMADHKVIFWNDIENAWTVYYLDLKCQVVCCKSVSAGPKKRGVCPECGIELAIGGLARHYSRKHKGVEKVKARQSATKDAPDTEAVRLAREAIEVFIADVQEENVMDISVEDYVLLKASSQRRLSGFIGECVQWVEQSVSLDPYVLGAWLGDGSQTGYVFSTDAKNDPEVLAYLRQWGENNDATFTHYSCVDYGASSTTRSGVAPLRKHLKKYGLLVEKHIPLEYLVNSREVRLKVLAGLIDTDGHVMRDGTRAVITQGMNHSRLADDIAFLVRSLGLTCSITVKDTQWRYEGELKRGKAKVINISGDAMDEIPTLIPRKRCTAPKRRDVQNTGTLSVREVASGKYIGIQVDGNNRFILKDFSVTHNCNIMSRQFTVEGADPETMQTLTQTWTDNMLNTTGPIVKKSKAKTLKGYTRVTWTPDFARFQLGGYTTDIVDEYTRFVIDAAMLTGKVAVFLNDERIAIKSLKDYASMYEMPIGTLEGEIIEVSTKPGMQAVITPSNGFEAVSFVNGVNTRDGGSHVEAWTEALMRPLVLKLNKRFDAENKERMKKNKQSGGSQSMVGINIGDVKQYFRIFIVATLIRPVFNSQDKHCLVKPKPKEIATSPLLPKHVTAVCKWSIMSFIDAILDVKELGVINKNQPKKRGFSAIDGLTPANKSGGKDSHKCTLILCEGLSAFNYVVTAMKFDTDIDGLSGSDWFGIYPLRGKIMNTQDDALLKVSKNKIISNIVNAIGLDYAADYSDDANFKKLKYGKIMMMTDADKDGIHISGLVINLFTSIFPTLCKRDNGNFITGMQTPIVRITRPRQPDLLLFDETRYDKFAAENDPKTYKVQYYKGLASSRAEDVQHTYNKKRVLYHCDDKATQIMRLTFCKAHTNHRKNWIDQYVPGQGESLDDGGAIVDMTYTNFINNEMIKHAVYNTERMIPHIMDGLKTCQRKVLYTIKKKGLTHGSEPFKVERLGSAVAEMTHYHHGEGNLSGVISGMANDYIAGNNIPLLDRAGLFGTRNHGGKDVGQGRYIFTRMEYMTQYIFRKEDDPILTYLVEERESVEPEFYVPIIPMGLVNGAEGIGTGWSCEIPMHNPLDLVAAVRTWIENEGEVLIEDPDTGDTISLLPEMVPWYRDFTGTIEFDPKHEKNKPRYITKGVCDDIARNKVLVRELPIGMWTDDFKKWCDTKREDKAIGQVDIHVSDRDIHFEITELPDGLKCSIKSMRLTSYLHVSNMCLWGTDKKIRKYNTVDLIIDEFCRVRYEFYIKRKRHILQALTHDLKVLLNKKRYIKERLSKKLVVEKRALDDVVDEMEDAGYYQQGNLSDECRGYAYLLDMGDRQRTSDKIDLLEKSITSTEAKLKEVQTITEMEMWSKELDEFVDHYGKWLTKMERMKYIKSTKKGSGSGKGKGKAK